MSDKQAVSKGGKLFKYGARLEETVLCLTLAVMIGLACLQIVLRSVFSSGLLWADPLLRYLVLWSGLLGAAMATSRGKHIALDVVGYLLPERFQPWVLLCTHLFSSTIAGWLTYAALLFIRSEAAYGGPGLFGLSTWVWNLVFPFTFLLIAVRYLILFVQAMQGLATPAQETAGKESS